MNQARRGVHSLSSSRGGVGRGEEANSLITVGRFMESFLSVSAFIRTMN
jgi:hypothetical protein